MAGNSQRLALGGAILLSALAMPPAAHAEDFLSALLGAFGAHRPQPPMTPLPYASEEAIGTPESAVPRARIHSYSGGQAFCVRTCDGRYFPISSSGSQSRAASCNGLCPASETRLVYGGNIDSAVTENGRPYSELPNAFRYRSEMVTGCTCNGKDPTGLAAVKIEDDATLRRGDLVAESDGLMVVNHGADRRGASLDLVPASEQLRSRYRHVPVVAAQ